MAEVIVDNDNAVELTELKIQLEAVEDKIIVVMDQFKSGFECATCGGSGKIKSPVVADALKDCPDCHGKGALLIVPEIAKSLPTLGTVMSVGEKTRWASHLREYIKYKLDHPNLDSLQESPEEAENRRFFKGREKEIKIRPGAKVLFQPHVGTLIPFKGNLRLKIMREHEPLCVIYGTDIEAKNFMDFDTPLEDRY